MTTNNEHKQVRNPVADGLKIMVSIPADIKIKLVDETILNAYEIWAFLAGVTSNFMSGLWVWYGQNTNTNISTVLLVVAIFISLLFLTFLAVAFSKKQKMKKETKVIELPVGSIEEQP
jgi:hypothetical protein